ncbi:MAG: hypothetical protein KAI24_07310, partial [Planctomycetes bacterium]|nr:hypothetical protein [Planctomycetota bacterium]
AALFSATMLAAQEPQDPTPRPPELEATQLDARAAAVKELPNLSDGDRTAAAQSYARAIETARTGDGDARKAAGFATDRARAGQRLEETRSELARQLPPVRPEPPQAATVADLEQLAAGFAEAARTAASRLRDAEDALALRAERLPKLPRLIATARERVNAALAKLETPELQGATSEPAMARRVEAIAERYAARQRLAALEAEMAWHDGSDGLLTALRDLAARDAARADELATKWQELVTARRTSEARAAEQSAAQAAAAAKDQQRHPLIVALAEGNEELARKRTAATTELGDINEREAATNARRKAIEDDYQDVTRRVKAVGLTDAMGALLRDRRASLPDLRSTRRRVQMRQQRLASLQIERFDLDNQHQQLKDPEYVPRLLRQAEPPIAANDAAAAAVADLVAARIETVEALRADDGKLFDALIRVDTADQKLMATVETYAEFINERVLWIRSTTPIWSPRLRELGEALDPLPELNAAIAAALVDEPPTTIKEGGLIRRGFHQELDELRDLAKDSTEFLARYQQRLVEQTGISTLKVGFNRVFGYYIEVTHTHSEVELPAEFVRKQTTKNAERYVTDELRELETKILKAEENSKALEYELFNQLRDQVADSVDRLQRTAHAVADVDACCSLATVAIERDYCRPTLDESRVLKLEDARHPVLEATHAAGSFVANDTDLEPPQRRLVLLTGPNMAGKSTWIRQNALIVIMAQIGS